MIEENKQQNQKGRDSKFGSNGWVFDKLFTVAGKLHKAVKPPTKSQKMRDDYPDYKQVTQESLNFMNKIGKSEEHKKLIDKIRAIVKNINVELNKKVSSKGIEQYDLASVFKQMFELYDLTDFGKYTITEIEKTKTSQILNLLNYIMKWDAVYKTEGLAEKNVRKMSA